MTYEAIPLDGTVATVATINDVLDTIIPATTKGGTTADTMQLAGPGILNGGTLAENIEFLHIDIDPTVADVVFDFHGLLVEYTPKFYKGHIAESPAWQNKN